MNKILKFGEYRDWEGIATDFIYQIKNSRISESDESSMGEDSILKACKDIGEKFRFNIDLTLTFGTGVKLFYPVVSKFVENLQLEIKPTTEDIVLLCITTISIIYLRHKKDPPLSEEDIKNKLNPEVQMKFGNPRKLVEGLVKSFRQIYQFIKKFPKLFGVALDNIFDMFTYTTILIPVMNAIGMFCDKYDLTPENLVGNLASLGVGISTISSKRLIGFISNKLNKDKPEEDPNILSDVGDLEEIDMGRSKLIKEQ
jgi:hypothetical protein